MRAEQHERERQQHRRRHEDLQHMFRDEPFRVLHRTPPSRLRLMNELMMNLANYQRMFSLAMSGYRRKSPRRHILPRKIALRDRASRRGAEVAELLTYSSL